MADQGGLLGMDPDLVNNIALGLLSVGGKNLAGQGNLGQAMQGALGNYYAQKQAKQGLQAGAIDLQTKQIQNQKMKSLMDMVGQLAGPPAQGVGPGPGMTTPSGAGAAVGPGPQIAPQSAPSLPSSLTPPTQAQIAASPVNGMDARTLQGYNLLTGKDPMQSSKEQEAAQYEQAQKQYAPTLAKLKTVTESDSPAKFVAADPTLKAAWGSIAPSLGYDPVNDFNDQKVRNALTFTHNQIASAVGLPTLSPTNQVQTKNGPLGSIYQTDPITGKTTQVKGEEELQQIIDPKTGQPTLVPKSQAAGATPFNANLFGASNVSDQSKEYLYQNWKQTHELPPGYARSPAMVSSLMNYIAQRTAQDGDTAGSQIAAAQQTKAAQGVLTDFTKGKSSQSLNGINTAVQHMAALDPLIDALGNGDIKVLNKVGNTFQEQTGSPAPTNFAALKEFVGGEVAKAVLPGGGGEAERQALTAPLNAANSPAQLKGAVQTIKTALAGKTEALRNQWDVGTGGTQGSFDKFLLPETKNALGIKEPSSAAPPITNPQGWVLHQDAKGNKAYVSPDGKQFQEVK